MKPLFQTVGTLYCVLPQSPRVNLFPNSSSSIKGNYAINTSLMLSLLEYVKGEDEQARKTNFSAPVHTAQLAGWLCTPARSTKPSPALETCPILYPSHLRDAEPMSVPAGALNALTKAPILLVITGTEC